MKRGVLNLSPELILKSRPLLTPFPDLDPSTHNFFNVRADDACRIASKNHLITECFMNAGGKDDFLFILVIIDQLVILLLNR